MEPKGLREVVVFNLGLLTLLLRDLDFILLSVQASSEALGDLRARGDTSDYVYELKQLNDDTVVALLKTKDVLKAVADMYGFYIGYEGNVHEVVTD